MVHKDAYDGQSGLLCVGLGLRMVRGEANYGQNETEYWLLLLKDTHFIDEVSYKDIAADCSELIKMLVSSINTTRKNLKAKTK